jgi:hypothetical protein
LNLKRDTTQCMAASGACMVAVACNVSDETIQWRLLDPGAVPGSRVQNVGTGSCIAAPSPHEASAAVMAPCGAAASPETTWSPLCEPRSAVALVPPRPLELANHAWLARCQYSAFVTHNAGVSSTRFLAAFNES